MLATRSTRKRSARKQCRRRIFLPVVGKSEAGSRIAALLATYGRMSCERHRLALRGVRDGCRLLINEQFVEKHASPPAQFLEITAKH